MKKLETATTLLAIGTLISIATDGLPTSDFVHVLAATHAGLRCAVDFRVLDPGLRPAGAGRFIAGTTITVAELLAEIQSWGWTGALIAASILIELALLLYYIYVMRNRGE